MDVFVVDDALHLTMALGLLGLVRLTRGSGGHVCC